MIQLLLIQVIEDGGGLFEVALGVHGRQDQLAHRGSIALNEIVLLVIGGLYLVMLFWT